MYPLRPGVELRVYEPRHAPALFALTDRNREHLRRWLPWLDTVRTPADTEQFIRGALAQYAAGDGFQTGVWVEGDLAGSIGFHPFNRAHRHCSLGYWLGAEYEGRGLITGAVRALVDHAFRAEGMNRVEIRAATGNVRSRAVPERLGFTQEGVIRDAEWLYDHFVDHAVYGMLAREWHVAGNER